MQRCECRLIALFAAVFAAIAVAEQTKAVQDVVAGLRSGPARRVGLRKNPDGELRIRQASAASSLAQVQHSSQHKAKPSSRIPTVVHNKSAGNGYEKGSPLYQKQEAMSEEDKEIILDSSKVPTKNKIYLSLINIFGLGLLGVDRCYMGHVGQGIIKALTLGGVGIWFWLDYFLIMFNCLLGYKSIDVLGYHAKFREKEVGPAFWISLLDVVQVVAIGWGSWKAFQHYKHKRKGVF